MKIGIQTWGSEGDIRPFIALGSGLRSAGHDVELVVTSVDGKNYEALGNALGFEIRHVGDASFSKNPDALRRLYVRILAMRDVVKQLKGIWEAFFLPAMEEMYAASERLCRENDAVAGHFFVHPLSIAAEKHAKPYVAVILCHGAVPSAHIAPADAPDLGPFVNRILWNIGEHIFNWHFRPAINALRQREGLTPIGSVLREGWPSKMLTLIAVSRCLCEPKPDFGPHHEVCGFFNLPEEAQQWDMPDDLAAFLDSGPAPVYMTFGSMATIVDDSRLLRESFKLLADAAELAGCRAVIQAPWEKIPDIPRSRSFYRIGAVPHDRIFRHCAAVVHHGGSGTTQSATRAGLPSVVVAHVADQIFWGKELHRIGIAPRVLSRRTVTPKKIARAISAVLGSSSMKERAKAAGEIMRHENGVASAVSHIESLLRR